MEQFTMERNGSKLILHISQELDHHMAGQIGRVVDLQIEKGSIRTLIFDFSGITFMDSSGIGMVMGRHRKMNFLGGRTFVTGIGDAVDRIFQMSGLYRIIPKYQESQEGER
jgi:stage II sporulation protein AA (anti-sigma F factor antagonist)